MARFDFDSDTRRKLGYRLIDQIDAFFSSLPDRPVQLPADERTYGRLSNPLPEIGEDAAKVLDEICREAGGSAQSAARDSGAFPVGFED